MSSSILCVSNDAAYFDRLSRALREQGMRVFYARDTRSAMEIFMRDGVDLVLLDFALGETDGGILGFEMRRRKPQVRLAFVVADPKANFPGALVDAVFTKGQEPAEIVPDLRRLIEQRSKVA